MISSSLALALLADFFSVFLLLNTVYMIHCCWKEEDKNDFFSYPSHLPNLKLYSKVTFSSSQLNLYRIIFSFLCFHFPIYTSYSSTSWRCNRSKWRYWSGKGTALMRYLLYFLILWDIFYCLISTYTSDTFFYSSHPTGIDCCRSDSSFIASLILLPLSRIFFDFFFLSISLYFIKWKKAVKTINKIQNAGNFQGWRGFCLQYPSKLKKISVKGVLLWILPWHCSLDH